MSIDGPGNGRVWTLLIAIAALAFVGCSEQNPGNDTDAAVDTNPRSAGTDALGCMLIDPTPWTLPAADYQSFCGDECRPFSGNPEEEPEADWFIACISKDIVPFGTNNEFDVCMRSPVDGSGYVVSTSKSMFLATVCWLPCFADGPDDPALEISSFVPYPEYCFR
jgi:hypothetical protein